MEDISDEVLFPWRGNKKVQNIKQVPETKRWVDPLTKTERWFSRLPCRYIKSECYCGSGKPELYWSPEDGTGCEDCKSSFHSYIPTATMFNIMDKFDFPLELRTKIYALVNPDEKEKGDVKNG